MKVIFIHAAKNCDYVERLTVEFDSKKRIVRTIVGKRKVITEKEFISYRGAYSYFQKQLGRCVLGHWANSNNVKIIY